MDFCRSEFIGMRRFDRLGRGGCQSFICQSARRGHRWQLSVFGAAWERLIVCKRQISHKPTPVVAVDISPAILKLAPQFGASAVCFGGR